MLATGLQRQPRPPITTPHLLGLELRDALRSAGATERNVNNRFERNWLPFPGCRFELPLTEGGNEISVELLVNAFHQLDAVHGSIGENHSVQDHFTLDVFLDKHLRILGIDL